MWILVQIMIGWTLVSLSNAGGIDPVSKTSKEDFKKTAPEGFLWYSALKQRIEQKQKKEPSSPAPYSTLDPLEKMAELQKAFERATAKAVLEPSYQNVKEAQYFQERIMRQAEAFQKMWQWVLLQDSYHWQKNAHGNRVHRELLKEESHKEFGKNLQTLAKNFGLFFFFKEDCTYCHAFAPFVKQFADTYGFAVKVVSGDHITRGLKEFPSAVMDNGTIRKLNPQGIFPALFLVNPLTQEVLPLSWGLNSISVLEENANLIYKQTFEKKDKESPVPLKEDLT
ncbi:MAG: conjugal transfer protein TraF [Alphaproteobacteria bacterium]